MRFFVALISWSAPRLIALFAQLFAPMAFNFAITAVIPGLASLYLRLDAHLATLIPFLTPSHRIIPINKELFATRPNGSASWLTTQSSATNVSLASHFAEKKVQRVPRPKKATTMFLQNGQTVVEPFSSLGMVLHDRARMDKHLLHMTVARHEPHITAQTTIQAHLIPKHDWQ
jgi:hypothetical protein